MVSLGELDKSLDYIMSVKTSTTFYMAYLRERIETFEEDVASLDDKIAQAGEKAATASRLNLESEMFSNEILEEETKLKELSPFLDVIDEIAKFKYEIRAKEVLMISKEELLTETKHNAARNGYDLVIQEEARVAESDFIREKTVIGLEISRLLEAIQWQRHRLQELEVKEDSIVKLVAQIREEKAKLEDLTEQKRAASLHYTDMLVRDNIEIDRLKEVNVSLQKLIRERDTLQEVMSIVGKVVLDAKSLAEREATSVS